MTGAQALVAALEELGVDLVFGLPGVHNLAAWEALAASPVRLVGVRHEQTAVYAADGLARTTGRLGVALTTTGPGAANAVTATGEAHACGSPVVVLATDIPSTLRRPGVVRGALHETSDQAALFAPVTKTTMRVGPADSVGDTVRDAAAMALAAPRGPVYVEIPTDLLAAEEPATFALAPGVYGVDTSEEVAAGARLLAAARHPLVWAGAGAVDAGDAVAELAVALGAPVFETYGARGLLPPGHPCRIGLPPHVPEAGALWDAADVVVAVGSDLDGMNTQNWLQPAPPQLVAINVDAADATKNYAADVVLATDAADGCARLAAALAGPGAGSPVCEADAAPWADLAGIRAAVRARLEASDPEPLAFLDALAAGLDDDVAVVADMCIPGYWTAALHAFARPRRLAYPVGWGTLGFAFPAAIGAALAGERTLALCGDGGFLFAAGELATVVQEQAPLTILLVDDGGYGMLRFDQTHAGGPPVGVDLHTPDWLQLAAAFGLHAERVADLAGDLRRHLADPRPTLLVAELALRPPETTSPRWYRKAAQT